MALDGAALHGAVTGPGIAASVCVYVCGCGCSAALGAQPSCFCLLLSAFFVPAQAQLACPAAAVQAKQAERDATTARMEVEALGDAYQKVRGRWGCLAAWLLDCWVAGAGPAGAALAAGLPAALGPCTWEA